MPVAKRNKGTVRRSQLITTYGVGAIIAAKDESFMVAGIDQWHVGPIDINEPRLERQLRVQGFVLPPATDGGADIPVVRFPTVYSCPSCRRLAPHKFFSRPVDNRCNLCALPLVPSRFVVACKHGHIDDFPYFEWVHKDKGPRAGDEVKHELRIEAGGVSAALRDIVISCSCGKSSTMHGAFGRDALKPVKKCTGKRPWLGDSQECSETPRTLQRGASNVYFAIVRSALSIPPWSEGAFKVINNHWSVLKNIPEVALAPTIQGMQLNKGTDFTVDDLVLAVKQRKEREIEGEPDKDEEGLRKEEYEALVLGKAEDPKSKQDFVCVPADQIDATVAEWFDRVMLVKRLREVRVLEKFTRLLPPDPTTPEDERAPLSSEPQHWLPAIDVLGEGVFLRLNETRLQAWETRPEVRARADKIDRNYAERFARFDTAPDKVITPRLLLIHTLAHVLINQWSLDAGYPAASLRERLYVSKEMCGLLIYTATTDAAGSLGGVVAQADAKRLNESLREAITRTAWCSADPLCIEADAAGVDSLNLAACHACVLLPETSCETANVLLDRGLVVGTPDRPDLGFLAPLLEES